MAKTTKRSRSIRPRSSAIPIDLTDFLEPAGLRKNWVSAIWRRSITARCWRIAVVRTATHWGPSAILGPSFARWQTALVLETQVKARVTRRFRQEPDWLS